MEAWYLVQTKARRERAALENLERQGFACYLPRLRVRRRRRGEYRAVVEPMFPGYLFLRLSDEHDDWGPIRSTIGVARLVRFGTTPARVPDSLVAQLRARDGADGVQDLPQPDFEPGARVRIVDGAMAGLEAIFHARSGAERVVVLLEVAQRQVQVELRDGSLEQA